MGIFLAMYSKCRLLSASHEDGVIDSLETPSKQYQEPSYSQLHNLDLMVCDTPSTSNIVSNRMTPFGQRSNKFVLQFSLHSDKENGIVPKHETEDMEDDLIRRVRPSERCSLHVLHSHPEPGCRYMYDRTEDRVIS